MKVRLGKAAGLLLAVVVSVGLLTVVEAGPASACTVYPGTSVYCWPQGGPVPPPVQPVPYRHLAPHRLMPHRKPLSHRPVLRRW